VWRLGEYPFCSITASGVWLLVLLGFEGCNGKRSANSTFLYRVVGSPLYTDHPETMKFLDLSKDFLLPPEEIAKAMFALLTEAKYKAGTILEVCDIGNWREVGLLNDSGPRGPASTTSNKAEAI